MSWNDFLYLYSQERGGQYFGGRPTGAWTADGAWDASLLLEHRGGPLLVSCAVLSSGRYGCSFGARVQLRCTLQREYALKISPKSMARQGMNAVLNQLDRGAEKLGIDLVPDEYAEELKGRSVKSSAPQFTKLVLGDLELRGALLASPKYSLTVGRCAPSYVSGPDLSHLISAQAGLADWDISPPDVWLSEEQRLTEAETRNFFPRLDALIDLAKTALAAVTAWPMPEP